ncbi:MAG: DUF167 domain-containing protein [Candidatus ainarchaeum sp.]|nr:DUF167 domain-containing protein [Candidatus ainarchaeum sp.]
MKLYLKVSTGKKAFRIVFFNDDENKLFVELKNNPKDNKANIELIKNLKKFFNCEVNLISGFKSKEKLIEIISSKEEINLVLLNFSNTNSIKK